MSDSPVSVVIPVGPREGHRRWLGEALASCAAQTLRPHQVLLVSDGVDSVAGVPVAYDGLWLCTYRAPWRLGPAMAFNIGVALSETEYVYFLASDDTLEPECLERSIAALAGAKDPSRALVWSAVRYLATGEVQRVPCGAMLVSKSLWTFTRGYPLETAVGAQDWLLLSALMGPRGQAAGIEVIGAGDEPLYNYRTHPDTENEVRKGWWPAIEQVHAILDATWSPVA